MPYSRPSFMPQDGKKEKSGSAAALLKGVLAGVLSEFLMSLVLTAVLLGTEDPMKLLTVFACTAQIVGAVIGSAVCVLCDRGRSVVNSVLFGAVYALAAVLLTLFFPKDGGTVDAVKAVLVYVGCILASAAVGFIFRRRETRIGVGDRNPAALARRRLGRH